MRVIYLQFVSTIGAFFGLLLQFVPSALFLVFYNPFLPSRLTDPSVLDW